MNENSFTIEWFVIYFVVFIFLLYVAIMDYKIKQKYMKAKGLRNTIIDFKLHIESLKSNGRLKDMKSTVAMWYIGGSGLDEMPEEILNHMDFIHRNILIILEAKLAQATKELEEL